MRRLALASLLFAGDAFANATAIPDGVQVHAASPDPDRLVMNTTFGFLFSEDAGATWDWTCHEAVTTATAAAPRTALSPAGSFFVAVPLGLGPLATRGLWRTANDGCDWDSVSSLDDVTVRTVVFSSDGSVAVAIGSSKTGDTALAWRSTDGGVTFGVPVLSVAGEIFNNAAFAPAGSRIYIAGIDTGAPAGDRSRLWRSDDRGIGWSETSIPQGAQPPLYVLAISSADPDVVWLRNDAGAIDRLLLSTDGGASASEAATFDADISGFALTDAGATRWLGVKRSNGLYAATDLDPVFEPIAGSLRVRCLEADGNVLYACGDPNVDGLAAGRTTDGATWTTAMVFARIQGPLACADGSDSKTICDPLWPALATKLGLDTPTPTPTPNPGDDDGGSCPCSTTDSASPAPLVPALVAAAAFLGARARITRFRR